MLDGVGVFLLMVNLLCFIETKDTTFVCSIFRVVFDGELNVTFLTTFGLAF